ncbi:CGNR zinc finger domain-containing protein [Frondihabitans australicus]|uniref:CGNR zinc finger protein n=1 Tax=Frondihabitans australicus TaxID=386892 RepID=A0A495IBY7_9MICO|nr:CGNR zinc finger domain-containing protein [Frondihabitans australicus]RKR73523.1 CGNR zinc finger protein [Frondihabitans australicus]
MATFPPPAPGESDSIALALVNTLVVGARGAVDFVADAAAWREWATEHALPVGDSDPAPGPRITDLRAAVRAALEAGPSRLPQEAVRRINDAAARVPVVPALVVAGVADPALVDGHGHRTRHGDPHAPAIARLVPHRAGAPGARGRGADGRGADARGARARVDDAAAALARDAIALLASPAALRVRECAAPDCSRLFRQDHARRIWCSTACGDRVRVARHAARSRG